MDDLADMEYAARIVSLLVHSYPQQAHDPEVYEKQLVTLCMGQPKDRLKLLVHPIEGIMAKTKFLPSIAEVGEWLGIPQRKIHEQRMSEYERLSRPRLPAPEIAAEERAKRVDQLHALAAKMRADVKDNLPPAWDDGSVLSAEDDQRLQAIIGDPEVAPLKAKIKDTAALASIGKQGTALRIKQSTDRALLRQALANLEHINGGPEDGET